MQAPGKPKEGAAGGGGGGGGRGKEAKEAKYDEHQKFDEFEGNDMGLFAAGEYDEDDKEADDRVGCRGLRGWMTGGASSREARLKEEIEKYRASNPKITEQFADLKRKLGDMSSADWDSIPEIGDYSLRNKKKRFESFVPRARHACWSARARSRRTCRRWTPSAPGWGHGDALRGHARRRT